MRKLLVALLCLNLSYLNQVLANESDDLNEEEAILQQEVASEETSRTEFSHLVKSTMDLMGPPLEVSQSTDLEQVPKDKKIR